MGWDHLRWRECLHYLQCCRNRTYDIIRGTESDDAFYLLKQCEGPKCGWLRPCLVGIFRPKSTTLWNTSSQKNVGISNWNATPQKLSVSPLVRVLGTMDALSINIFFGRRVLCWATFSPTDCGAVETERGSLEIIRWPQWFWYIDGDHRRPSETIGDHWRRPLETNINGTAGITSLRTRDAVFAWFSVVLGQSHFLRSNVKVSEVVGTTSVRHHHIV